MRRQLAWMIPVLLVGACKRPQPAAAPASTPPNPTTNVVAAAPATQPIGPAFMLVGDVSVEFPPARVVVKQPGEKVAALLFSVDPPQAINNDYRGNSFYFNMPELSLDDPTSINGAVWSYRAPDSDRQDSTDGMTIDGRQVQLQPFDVKVMIDGDSTPVHVKLVGTFLKFDNNNDQSPGQPLTVRAQFDAELKK